MEFNPVITQRIAILSWMEEHGYSQYDVYFFLVKSQGNPKVLGQLLKPFGLPDELIFE